MARTITLNHITKIEGHAKLHLSIDKGNVKKCEFSATEGSRYFEGLVIGRRYNEAYEITSRICGICSCAHIITSISAIENALNVKPSEQTVLLRKLLTLGERIRSHATHLYFLALPDYLGYESALAMASKYRQEINCALNLMKVGNNIIKVLGSRDLHPVSATIGGWLKLPKQESIEEIKGKLILAKKDAIKTCKLFFSLNYPEFLSNTQMFSLVDKNEYAVLNGRFASKNMFFLKDEYRDNISEFQVEYSNANMVKINNDRYMVGALSRISNNHGLLSKDSKKMFKLSKIKENLLNPFYNNIAQAIELVHCIDKSIEICDNLEIKDEKLVEFKVKEGNGVGAIEVPRGTLWHDYHIDKEGRIIKANIITPTAQNLLNIQEDIRCFVPLLLNKRKEDLIMDIEKLIRSYDPCFSCSAHFLEVKGL